MFRKLKKWTKPLWFLIVRYIRLKCAATDDKILLVAEFGAYGGTRTYFFSLLRFLHSQNYKVVAELSEHQQDPEVMALLKQLGYSYITRQYDFGRIAFQPKVLSKFNINPLKKTIHALNEYLNILYQQKVSRIAVSVGSPDKYLYFFLLPLPLLYIVHTVTDERLDNIRAFWLRYINRKKQLITVSEYSANAMIKYWGLMKKKANVHYVYNYYPKLQDEKESKTDESLLVLTIGSVEWYKNPEFWVQTAQEITRKHQNTIFYWLGDGSMLEKCRLSVAQNPNIQFVGFDADVEKWYQKAHIYFQPSLKESFGIAVAGAMAHGLPSVVSDKEALPEIIDNHVSGLVYTANLPEYAVKAINELIEDSAKRIVIGKNARRVYLEKFNPDIWQNLMTKLFNKWT